MTSLVGPSLDESRKNLVVDVAVIDRNDPEYRGLRVVSKVYLLVRGIRSGFEQPPVKPNPSRPESLCVVRVGSWFFLSERWVRPRESSGDRTSFMGRVKAAVDKGNLQNVRAWWT
jgi:hypothetical protein